MVNEEKIKNWYNQRHIAMGSEAWRPYEAYSVFLDYLNARPGRKLLDVGCGTGYLLKAASRRGLETYGVDISKEGVKIAKKNSPASEIVCGRGEELNFPAHHFDYITCLGALEHFLDMKKGLAEMSRVVKNGALFCIMVPNSNFLYWKIRGSAGTEQQDINENLLTLKEWKDLFTRAGLRVLRVHKDKWFAKKPVYKIAWALMPLNYTYQFVFVLKKEQLASCSQDS